MAQKMGPTDPPQSRSSVAAVNVESDVAPGALFEAFANEDRRLVLRHLRTAGGRASLDDLATAVAEDAGATADTTRRTAIQLHHNHLSKLENLGLVVYDREARTVELRDTGALAPYLSELAAHR